MTSNTVLSICCARVIGGANRWRARDSGRVSMSIDIDEVGDWSRCRAAVARRPDRPSTCTSERLPSMFALTSDTSRLPEARVA